MFNKDLEKFISENYIPHPLVGKVVIITDKESIYCGEWGTIVDFDGTDFAVAIANGTDSIPIFARSEFKVPRKKVVS